MSKTLSFIRLDFVTIKAYLTLKNIIIFIAVALIMLFTSGTAASAIAIIMVYAALYVSYPFAVGEQNGIDALYPTLSVRRDTVVLGRYVFTLLLDVFSGLAAYIFAFIVLTVMSKEFDPVGSFWITLGIFALYSVIQAIQLPIFFKLGYAKAKFMTFLPFIGFPLSIFLSGKVLNNVPQIIDIIDWFTVNPAITACICTLIWLIVMVISIQVSTAFYKKRDF